MSDAPPKLPNPFPANFNVDDGLCILCGGELDTGWECNDCGADHFPGVRLIIEQTKGPYQ